MNNYKMVNMLERAIKWMMVIGGVLSILGIWKLIELIGMVLS